MAECIHGFDEGLCDICFPRKVLEPVPTVAASATRTAPRAPRTSSTSRPAGRVAGSSGPKLPPFGSRRLYHVTHARNLESILLDGELRAIGSGLAPDVDPVQPVVRELRARAGTGDGRHAADLVPFALSPDADHWIELRNGAPGSLWTPAATAFAAADFVVLVAVAKDLGGDLVIADGDAAAPVTRFHPGDPARGVAQAARRDPGLTAAEVLVPAPVPLSALNLIAVANEPMRARVRGMFRDVEGVAPRVVVHPPWFAAS